MSNPLHSVDDWKEFERPVMTLLRSNQHRNFWPRPTWGFLRSVVLVCAIFAGGAAAVAQEQFATPDEAVDALMKSVRSGDIGAVARVLGPGSAEIVSSGDPVDDAAARKRVIDAFDTKHQVMTEGEDKATLIVGNEEWPFPIPLVRMDGRWQFDANAGREEILYRRIGRNELSAIQACLAYVDAQDEYAERGIAGNGVYAQRIMSSAGKKDGLFWPPENGANESPLGELAASASAQGYRLSQQRRSPYHGYFFKVLTRQGANAPGGAIDYVTRGKMIGGFGLVAYPAEYGNSGIMTFLVNHQGVVYEKDLGANTARIAQNFNEYNPDSTWRRVDALNRE
jgi:hypothetical protein